MGENGSGGHSDLLYLGPTDTGHIVATRERKRPLMLEGVFAGQGPFSGTQPVAVTDA